MNQPIFHGSATILPFRPRPSAATVFSGRPAEIARLRPLDALALEVASSPVVDVDGWYHAEAMHDAVSGKH